MTTKINGRDVWHELPEEDHKALLDLVPRSIDEAKKSQITLGTYIRTGRILEREGLSRATNFLKVEDALVNYPRKGGAYVESA